MKLANLPADLARLITSKRRPDDVTRTAAALETARVLVTEAEHALATAEAEHEEKSPEALARNDAPAVERLAQAVADARHQLDLSQTTLRAVERRHQAAQEAAGAARLAEAWKRSRELAATRLAVAQRAERAMDDLAAALAELTQLDVALVTGLPVCPSQLPDTVGHHGVSIAALAHLAPRAPGAFRKFTPPGHTLESAMALPTFSERIAYANKTLLAAAPSEGQA